MDYRKDIDGLRAIAVLSVVLFHYFPKIFPAGFVGVDIFFVISGFLISNIILTELDKNKLSIFGFYAKRINRIFPSLIVVLTFIFIVGVFFLRKSEMKELGKHIYGGAYFISNFINYHEGGYFSTSSEDKPLLHLWSLGIEEQFYICFPFFQLALYKLRIKISAVVLLVLSASFVANIYYSYFLSNDAFYLPFNRSWELLTGVSATIFLRHYQEEKNSNKNTISAIGITLIFLGMLFISDELTFPGWVVLFPIVGTFLLMVSGVDAEWNQKMLTNNFLVKIGLISYPLYLWHWPLLSYWRIIEANEPSVSTKLMLLFVAFLLAYLTYQFIETPIRFRARSKWKPIVLLLIVAVIGLAGILVARRDGILPTIIYKNITTSRLENIALLEWGDYKTKGCAVEVGVDASLCLQIGDPNNIRVAVLGDSTGNSLAPGLGEMLKEHGVGLINVGTWTCPPIRGLVENLQWGKDNHCVSTVDHAYDYVLKSDKITTVVLAIFARDLQNWGIPGVKRNNPLEEKFKAVSRLLDKDIDLLTKSGKKVVVTYDMPYFPVAANKCIPRPITGKISDQCRAAENLFVDRQPYLKIFNDYFNRKNNLCIVRQSNVLVSDGVSRIVDESGGILMRDNFHLSKYGSEVVAKEFFKSQCLILKNL